MSNHAAQHSIGNCDSAYPMPRATYAQEKAKGVFTALLILFFWVPLWRRDRGGGHP